MLENSKNSLLKNFGGFQGQEEFSFLYKRKDNGANGKDNQDKWDIWYACLRLLASWLNGYKKDFDTTHNWYSNLYKNILTDFGNKLQFTILEVVVLYGDGGDNPFIYCVT